MTKDSPSHKKWLVTYLDGFCIGALFAYFAVWYLNMPQMSDKEIVCIKVEPYHQLFERQKQLCEAMP